MTALSVEGEVAPGWSPVADAFRSCFTEHNDLGAAVAVYADGTPVVDLWAGTADATTQRPWQRDTVAMTFSTTKGVTAICALILTDQGLLDLDEPVATYWPEFAAQGKQDVPVRWLLTHQAGLPYVDADMSFEDLEHESPVVEALAAQAPLWEPGTRFAYHAVTYGHLVGEVIRRATGLHLKDFFATQVASPLGLSAWIGLPADTDVDLARLERVTHPAAPLPEALLPSRADMERAISLGSALTVDLVVETGRDCNDRRVLAIPLGGTSLVSDARSLARTYAATVRPVDGVRLLSDSTIRNATSSRTADVPYFRWPQEYSAFCPFDFGLGFAPMAHLATPSFGHAGAGGSVGWGNLEAGVGFGYVMNRMEATSPDHRSTTLSEAVRRCLDG